MKRLKAILLSLAMLAALVPASPVFAADSSDFKPDENYEFVDTAYSPELGYVVSAKDYTKNANGKPLPTKIYNSKDGINWNLVHTDSTAYNNANKYSRQQLVWWEDAGVFAMSNGATIKTTSNLSTWASQSGASRGNAMIEASGDELLVTGGRATKLVDTKNYTGNVDYHIFDPASTATTALAVGVSPEDESGKRTYLAVTNTGHWVYTDDVADDPIADFTNVTKVTVNAFASSFPVDVKYIDAIGGWAVVNNSNRLYLITTGAEESNFVLNGVGEGEKISAIGTDANTIVIGTDTGKMYYADLSQGLNSETVWTLVSGSGMTDEVRSITETGNGSYFAATKTGIFSITSKNGELSYDVFSDTVPTLEIQKPVVNGTANAFEGTWLLGGVYSDVLDMYAVYGNTLNPTDGDYGRVYTSKDGITWSLALKSQVCFNTQSTDAAVWWDKAIENEDGTYSGAFVISCATNQSGAGKVSKAAWYSKDGAEWFYTQAFELCSDGDIIVHGDYLYTLTDRTVINKVSAMKPDGTVNIEEIAFVRTTDGGYAENAYGRKLAVSDDGNTFIISADYGNTMSWQVQEQKATSMNDGNPNGKLMEVGYDSDLGYFVGVTSFEPAIYGMWYENPTNPTDLRRLTLRPGGTGGPKMISFDKNDGVYAFGCTDGSVYVTDGSVLSTNTIFTTARAAEGKTANTIRVRDVVAGAEGKMLAVAGPNSQGESDALLIDLETKVYEKANDNVAVTVGPSDVLDITVPYVNTTDESYDAALIVAIYVDNALVQVDKKDVVLEISDYAEINTEFTVLDNVPEGSVVKVMLWNDAQQPYSENTIPVFG